MASVYKKIIIQNKKVFKYLLEQHVFNLSGFSITYCIEYYLSILIVVNMLTKNKFLKLSIMNFLHEQQPTVVIKKINSESLLLTYIVSLNLISALNYCRCINNDSELRRRTIRTYERVSNKIM